MIDLTFLKFFPDEIARFTNNSIDKKNVQWSDIIDQSGSVTIAKNSIAITLVKIEKEAFVNRPTSIYRDRLKTNHADAGYDTMPILDINFYIQFAVYNSSYLEALKQLGYILSYFQSHTVINNDTVTSLQGTGVDKLIFEIMSYSHQELSNLWSQLGAKYIPSVVYKMRMITLDAYDANTLVPAITKIDGTLTTTNS